MVVNNCFYVRRNKWIANFIQNLRPHDIKNADTWVTCNHEVLYKHHVDYSGYYVNLDSDTWDIALNNNGGLSLRRPLYILSVDEFKAMTIIPTKEARIAYLNSLKKEARDVSKKTSNLRI